MARRDEIKPDNVLNLLAEFGIVGELEAARQMRLQAMRRPDALHAGMAEADRLGELARRPRRARRLLRVSVSAEGLDLHHFYRAMAWLGDQLAEKPAGALVPRASRI